MAVMSKYKPNQVVAYNLRRARELRGWTQEEAAERLAPHIGTAWSKASWSAAERSAETLRVRHFSADDLVAFARCFDLPVVWFLVPPDPDDEGVLASVTTPDVRAGLAPRSFFEAVVGSADGLSKLEERLSDLNSKFAEQTIGAEMLQMLESHNTHILRLAEVLPHQEAQDLVREQFNAATLTLSRMGELLDVEPDYLAKLKEAMEAVREPAQQDSAS